MATMRSVCLFSLVILMQLEACETSTTSETTIPEQNSTESDNDSTTLSQTRDTDSTTLSQTRDTDSTTLSQTRDTDSTTLSQTRDTDSTTLSQTRDTDSTTLSQTTVTDSTTLSQTRETDSTTLSQTEEEATTLSQTEPEPLQQTYVEEAAAAAVDNIKGIVVIMTVCIAVLVVTVILLVIEIIRLKRKAKADEVERNMDRSLDVYEKKNEIPDNVGHSRSESSAYDSRALSDSYANVNEMEHDVLEQCED